DRQEALVALAEDIGGAGVEGDGGELAQRYVGVARGSLNPDLDVAHVLDIASILGRQPHHHGELAVRLQKIGRHRSPQGGLNDGIRVADVQAVARSLLAIDLYVQIGLPENPERTKIRNSLYLGHFGQNLFGDSFERRQIGAHDLDGVGAFDAREAFLDVILDVLRKIEVDADELLRKLRLKLLDELLLGESCRPLVERFQRHEELRVEKPRSVAAVVGTAMLRDHRDDLGMAQQNFPDLVHDRHARLERQGGRHRGANPQVAFLECRQELAAETRCEHAAGREESKPDGDRHRPLPQRPAQQRRVDSAQTAHEDRLDLVDVLREQKRSKTWRHREGRQQRSYQSVGIGSRHRTEDLALDALHGEQRDEGRDDDRGREEHRSVDLQRADQDQSQPVGPRRVGRRGVVAPALLGQMLQLPLSIFRRCLKVAIDILDQDDCGIDNDAEIDCADGQQICVFPAQDEDDDAEEQRERNVGADDDGAAQVAEEQPLHDENQQATEQKVVQDGAGGDGDERAAVVEWDQFHAGGKAAVGIDLVYFRPDAFDDVIGVQRAVHDDDRRNHVIVMVPTGLVF